MTLLWGIVLDWLENFFYPSRCALFPFFFLKTVYFLLLLPCFLWCYSWSSSSSIWPLAVCIYSRTGSHNPIAIEGTYLNSCKFVKVVLALVFMTSVMLQGSENGTVPDMSFRISSSSWVNVFLSRFIPITWHSSVQTCTLSSGSTRLENRWTNSTSVFKQIALASPIRNICNLSHVIESLLWHRCSLEILNLLIAKRFNKHFMDFSRCFVRYATKPIANLCSSVGAIIKVAERLCSAVLDPQSQCLAHYQPIDDPSCENSFVDWFASIIEIPVTLE